MPVDEDCMELNRIRVLLVDDQRTVVSEIRRLLSAHEEIDLDSVANAAVAVDVARALRPDVILQALDLREEDGFELLAAYRRTSVISEVPVILLAGTTDAGMRTEAFERGADDFLESVPEEVELVARIRMQAERRRAAGETRRVRSSLEDANRDISRLKARLEDVTQVSAETIGRDRAWLESITELDAELNAFQNFDLLLDRILVRARRACDAESGVIFTIDGERLKCRHIQNDQLEARGDRHFTQAIDRPLTMDTVAGTVALSGQPIRVEDAYRIPSRFDCVYDQGRDIATGYRTRALLSIPLRTSDSEVRGVLQIANPGGESEPRGFTPEDEKVVEHFATLAAVAIERTAMTEALVLRMIAMAEVRDPSETGAHVQRVAGYSIILYQGWADLHGIEDEERERNLDRLRTAAMLHDVGKVGIPDAILKKPGKLDEHEYALMQRHTVIGARLFKGMRTDFDEVARQVALHHHERWDGAGYPGPIEIEADLGEPTIPVHRGLVGEDIPLFARIVGIADVYDALSSRRSYKEPWPEDQVLDIIRGESGKHFDPELVQILLQKIKEFRRVGRRFGD